MNKCRVCKREVKGDFSYCYAHWVDHDKKRSQQVGRHKCKDCGAMITKDRSICWTCRTKRNAPRKFSWWPF